MSKTQEQLNKLRTLTQQNGALISMLGTESTQGKQDIVDAINYMGGDAIIDDTLTTLANKILNLNIIDSKTVLVDTVKKPISILDVKKTDLKEIYVYGESLPYSLKGGKNITKLVAPNLSVSSTEFLRNIGVESLTLPSLSSIVGTANFASLTNCITIELPILNSLSNYIFEGCIKLENLYLPNCSSLAISPFKSCSNLIAIEIGRTFSGNIDFSTAAYNPTTAYSKTSSSLVKEGELFNNNNEKWNHNLREYFAKNLQDRTGFSTVYTITFGSTVLSQMEEATIEAFTSKNWTLA